MGMNGMGGPDMAKMLQMMMPYMDPSTKRMMNIMMKLQELKSLMDLPNQDKAETGKSQQEQAAQPQRDEEASKKEGTSGVAPWETVMPIRTMDDMGKAEHKPDLSAVLKDGLTPEQQSMITSLSGMLR